jgi:hypothetical protein
MAKRKRTNNIIMKTKDRATRTPLKPGSELMCSGRENDSCSSSGTRLAPEQWFE